MKNYSVILVGITFSASMMHAGIADELFAQKNEDPTYSLFKNPVKLGEQQERVMRAAKDLVAKATAIDEGIFVDHAKKIETALVQLFSTINLIRRHMKDIIGDNHPELDNPDARDDREENLKHNFAKLNKSMIEDFIKRLKKAQSEMDGKFTIISNVKYRNNQTYKDLKEAAAMVDSLIKRLLTSKNELGGYQELLSLMKPGKAAKDSSKDASPKANSVGSWIAKKVLGENYKPMPK